MPILEMKFGGTSLADLDLISRAAACVSRETADGRDVFVIVYAMAGKTNELAGNVDDE